MYVVRDLRTFFANEVCTKPTNRQTKTKTYDQLKKCDKKEWSLYTMFTIQGLTFDRVFSKSVLIPIFNWFRLFKQIVKVFKYLSYVVTDASNSHNFRLLEGSDPCLRIFRLYLTLTAKLWRQFLLIFWYCANHNKNYFESLVSLLWLRVLFQF